MSDQDKVDMFLSAKTKAIKELIDISFQLIPALPQAKDEEGRSYVTYSYGVIIDPVHGSISSGTKMVFDKVMEKLREMAKDTPTLNESEYMKISFRRYPTFAIDGNKLNASFRCLSYVCNYEVPDKGAIE